MALQINKSVISVYWILGKLLHEKQIAQGYGSKVVKQLSIDLKSEFPDMGVSPRNLWDMKRFYERYRNASEKLRQAVALLPWGHNLLILSKIQNNQEALFYAEKSIQNGWSRELLLNYLSNPHSQLGLTLPHHSLLNSINSMGQPLCSIIATLTPSEGGFGAVITFRSRFLNS